MSREHIGTPTHGNGWWLVPVADHVMATDEPAIVVSNASAADSDRSAHVELRAAFNVSRKATLANVLRLVACRRTAAGEEAYRLQIQSGAGRIEARFAPPVPDRDTAAEIVSALRTRIDVARSTWRLDTTVSPWNVAELVTRLHACRRTDDGTDALAFRLASPSSNRTLYVRLDATLIRFDLEDPDAGSEEWDDAVARGAVDSCDALCRVASAWLLSGGLPFPRARVG